MQKVLGNALPFNVRDVTDTPQAISRLPKPEAYDRVYRMRMGTQSSVLHKDLPKEQWIKPEDVCILIINTAEDH